MGLNEKQQRFADYYIELGNATQSAIKAGYSKKSARFIGQENLTKPNIKKYIADKLEEMKSKRTADGQEVLEFLASVMRGEIDEEVILTVGAGEGYSEIMRTRKELSARDRIKAAELLGKRYTLFTDKTDLTVAEPVQIIKGEPKRYEGNHTEVKYEPKLMN
ncbi:terminase [Bacillus thuringiensis]|uniref:Terminase small subunit n=1 Tax=Bacillus thuringiensis TaxID=1428 RepID=A0A9W3X063_BACTU|nr:terminase small subunit [Bacillus thuringiensis]ANS47598.1 terminase small subunit [Bacillus thuringiensis]MBH0336152.1 terminase [Bacillus thuringiensis]